MEFGPKFDVSRVDGIAGVERLEFYAYHEGLSVVAACERYAARRGYYPARALADRAYTRDRVLRAYFKARGIKVSAAALGRPPKDAAALAAYEAALGLPGERNRMEGWFGVCKRRFGMDRLSCRKPSTTAGEVYLQSMAMNLMTALAASFYLWLTLVRAPRAPWTARKTWWANPARPAIA